MIFSVSNDGIEWSPGFGPDSVTLTVKDLHQEVTIISQENPLAAWSLLLSQRQLFLNNHLARVPVTLNRQRTHEKRDEVFPSVGAQEDSDTSRYKVSSADLDDVEFHWENVQLDVDAVFRPGIHTPFSPIALGDFDMAGRSPAWLRRFPFGTKIENVLLFIEICFNRYYRVSVLMWSIFNVFPFIITFFKN